MPAPRTVCLDFNGVLHASPPGYHGGSPPTGDPVPGAVEFVRFLLSRGYRVAVHSASFSNEDALLQARIWGATRGFPSSCVEFVRLKPPAVLYVDDRGWRFDGTWEELRARIGDCAPGDIPTWRT